GLEERIEHGVRRYVKLGVEREHVENEVVSVADLVVRGRRAAVGRVVEAAGVVDLEREDGADADTAPDGRAAAAAADVLGSARLVQHARRGAGDPEVAAHAFGRRSVLVPTISIVSWRWRVVIPGRRRRGWLPVARWRGRRVTRRWRWRLLRRWTRRRWRGRRG